MQKVRAVVQCESPDLSNSTGDSGRERRQGRLEDRESDRRKQPGRLHHPQYFLPELM